MNHLRRRPFLKLFFALALCLILGSVSAAAVVNADSHEMKDLLPRYKDFTWTYHGIAEYGHEMTVSSITKTDNEIYYSIDGRIYDASGGESGADYSLSLAYVVKSDRIVQVKEEESMLDSKYDSIELIRAPLEEGTTWTQEVVNGDSQTTLESTITNVETDRHQDVHRPLRGYEQPLL
jgi:hypothetical protein